MNVMICMLSHRKRRLIGQITLRSPEIPRDYSFVKRNAISLMFMILCMFEKYNVFSSKMCDFLKQIPDVKHSTVCSMTAALAGQLLQEQSDLAELHVQKSLFLLQPGA